MDAQKRVVSMSEALTSGLVMTAGVVIVLLGIRAMGEIVTTTVLAFIIAVCLRPVIVYFEKRGWSSGKAFAVTVLFMLIGGFGLLGFIWLSLGSLVLNLPAYIDQFVSRLAEANEAVYGYTGEEGSGLTGSQIERMTSLVMSVVTGLIGKLVDLGLMLFLAAFMLYESLSLKDKLKVAFAKKEKLLNQIRLYTHDLKVYVLVSAKMGALVGAADVVWFSIMGIEYAFLWGVLSFVMSFVPSIGFFIAAIPPVLLALVQYGWQHALIVFIGYWLINGTVDQLLKPSYMGLSLAISPMIVFWSILFWGFLLGPVGGLLAVPMTMGVKTLILDYNKETRWLGVLLSDSRTMNKGRKPQGLV